jgi:uncharacterized protein (TIGR03067 family)
MRHAVGWIVTLAVVLSPVLVQAEDKPDAERIKGSWKLVSRIVKGVEAKADSNQAVQEVSFDDQGWKAKVGAKDATIDVTGTFFLDDKQSPKIIDFTVKAGSEAIDVFAIYKFEKDQLHIRLRQGSGQRPVDFESAGDDLVTVVLAKAAN